MNNTAKRIALALTGVLVSGFALMASQSTQPAASQPKPVVQKVAVKSHVKRVRHHRHHRSHKVKTAVEAPVK